MDTAAISLRERVGVSRIVDGSSALPQRADRLDPTGPARPGEIEIDVDLLNIDSASWRQLRESVSTAGAALAEAVTGIVAATGRMKNPVTGSGGILVGTVVGHGTGRDWPATGSRIASLVSLSATPLALSWAHVPDPEAPVLQVRGRAFLPLAAPLAVLPEDLDEDACLGVLDVCGAPAWVAELSKPGDDVVVLGAGGKSGVLATAQALKSVGDDGRVVAVCWPPATSAHVGDPRAMVIAADCTDMFSVGEKVSEVLGRSADLVALCTNATDCEGAAILCADAAGTVLFFSMATSFAAAALGAESLGQPVRMMIGNGYLDGHADLALELFRHTPWLQPMFVHEERKNSHD